MQKLKEKKGITLIALVISIIVLLILSGTTITMLTGDNGILNKAADAKLKTEEAKADEEYRLALLAAASNVNGTTYTETISSLNEGYREVTVKIPAGFAISPRDGEQNIETGLVILDENGNEYVWIPVFTDKQVDKENNEWGVVYPDTLPAKTADNSEFTSQNITTIKTALRGTNGDGYTGVYNSESFRYTSVRSTCRDEWYGNADYGQYGYYAEDDEEKENIIYYTNGNMTEEEYNNLYKNMLISVYKNGGFYIGRYEMGTAVVNSTAEAKSVSRTSSSKEYDANEKPKIGAKPVIKKNAVPYNYITQSQAEMLAESMNHIGGTDSLLFGVQWDMVCVFLEHFGIINESSVENAGESFIQTYITRESRKQTLGKSQKFNI